MNISKAIVEDIIMTAMMNDKEKVISRLTGEHLITNAYISYENVRVLVNGKWYYMNIDKIIGMRVKGELITKRTREWLE